MSSARDKQARRAKELAARRKAKKLAGDDMSTSEDSDESSSDEEGDGATSAAKPRPKTTSRPSTGAAKDDGSSGGSSSDSDDSDADEGIKRSGGGGAEQKKGSPRKAPSPPSDSSDSDKSDSDEESKTVETPAERGKREKAERAAAKKKEKEEKIAEKKRRKEELAAAKKKKKQDAAKKKKAAEKKRKQQKRNAGGKKDRDSDDSETSDDSDTSEEDEPRDGNKARQRGRRRRNDADGDTSATGSSRRTKSSATLSGCCSSVGRAAVDVAARVVASCGGDLRKEPPAWLSDSLNEGTGGPPKLKYPVSQPVVLGMQIYGTDTLVQDPYVSSPVVMVHCLNALTGEYVTKADTNQGGAASYFEHQTNVKRSGRDVTRASAVCDRIMPLLTPPCRLGSRGVYGERLEWSDSQGRLIWNEPYDTFVRRDVVFIFEVLDIVPKGPSLDSLKQAKGWYRIAWGFLRPVGPDNKANVGVDFSKPKRLRLQLYYHTDGRAIDQSLARRRSRGSTSPIPNVYYSFLGAKPRAYPATLYVSVTGVKPLPTEDILDRRPLNAFERESHQMSFEDALLDAEMGEQFDRKNAGDDEGDDSGLSDQAKRVVRRTRAEGEPCLIPDTVVSRIPVGTRGCYALSFSNNGRYLAAACEDRPGEHIVRVFEVETSNPTTWGVSLKGHHAVIYNVCWNKHDTMIASASSDGTVIVWPVPRRASLESSSTQDGSGAASIKTKRSNRGMSSPGVANSDATGKLSGIVSRTILTHLPPCYVYCCAFHPGADDPAVLCTGAFDAKIRLWDVSGAPGGDAMSDRGALQSASASVLAAGMTIANDGDGGTTFVPKAARELGKLGRGVPLHASRINAMVFDKRGIRLFTGDGVGVVNVWRCNGAPEDVNSYRVIKRIEHPDVNKMPILSLSVSDATNSLLIHAQQSVLRLVELKYYRSPHSGFTGVSCGAEHVRSCFSADGRYVLSGSKSGGAHIWKAASGEPVQPAAIRGHKFGRTLSTVAWHPSQHLCALSSGGAECPILLLEADRDKVRPGDAIEASEIMRKRQESLEMNPEKLAEMDEEDLTQAQLEVLHEYRTARQQLGTQIYMHGVVEKFGGDVASALRSSIPDFSNNSRVANSADFSERKSAESSVSKVGSYSGRLPPMPRTRGSSSRRSAGRSSSSRTVADILAEHAVRKKARQNAVAQ